MPIIFLFLFFFTLSSKKAFALDNQTLIINQVRGAECCSVGEASNLKLQIETSLKLQLPTTFTLRYDVLKDQNFLNLIKNYQNNPNFEWGGFLEITPELAKDAGVKYKGDENNWYEAQFVYLIGYNQSERQKILETYMSEFKTIFGDYPKTTTAWMIDSFSLQLLKSKYGVTTHQITREQIGVDSYTLYGGPAHYPYYPSENWALIPSTQKNEKMPLIVRQTITDPVYNYGDSTSSFTSQPNDYDRRKANFSYFEHLFLQTHSQAGDQDTFALIGLENSMPLEIQKEFIKQLEFVKNWQKENPAHQILRTKDFAELFQNKNEENKILSVYGGQDQENPNEKAWWITTSAYQARLRLSNRELFISDLRFYDESFTDPYVEKAAKKLGWWIVPFVIDGSRYGSNDQSQQFDFLFNDSLIKKKETNLQPTRLTLAAKVDVDLLQIKVSSDEFSVKSDEQILAIFSNKQISLDKQFIDQNQNALLEKIKKDKLWELKKVDSKENLDIFEPMIEKKDNLLEETRLKHYPLLFPELSEHSLDSKTTYLYRNNSFAIANRNPVRLVLFPRDQYGYPVTLKTEPKITSVSSDGSKIDKIEVKAQSGFNGMLFLDFSNEKPLKSQVTIEKDCWSETLNIYFAPDCKSAPLYCLSHPQQAWWYVNSFAGDKWRALKEMTKWKNFK